MFIISPYISFIIPIRKDYSSLQALLKKIEPDLGIRNEVIIVRDSDDPPPANFKVPEWVKIVVTETRGLGPARNFALSHANGHFVAFIDADDEVRIPALLQVTKEMEDKACDLAISNYENRSEGGKTLVRDIAPGIENRPQVVADTTEKSHLKAGFFFCWNKIYRRSFLLDNEITFPSGEYEDVFWSVMAISLAKKIYVTDAIFYKYHFEASSAVNRPGAKHMDIISQYSHVLGALKLRGSSSEMLKIIRLQAVRHCLFVICKTDRLGIALRRKLYHQLVHQNILDMGTAEILKEPELSVFNRILMSRKCYTLIEFKRFANRWFR